ncbi:MAG TPA: LytTR family DNA-binding domain-containing protein [Chitinophagaceae bacterium]|jgi:DNA-binding LytR/AlgR family response regulator|nr:LytTR family DNA-binding domain-containing protein [Chitinophagaceae bacterium]
MIRCIITDDEPLARKGLKGYIARCPGLQLAGACESVAQLEALLREEPADLLFLDIEMPYRSGIDFLKAAAAPPRVVLITAYEQYALQGYEFEVLDYLLKPVSFDRFSQAVRKAEDYFARTPRREESVFLKFDGGLERVVIEDIDHIEAMQNYVAFYIRGRKRITHATLKSVQEWLPAFFVQTHKSYIVNTRKVTALDHHFVTCAGRPVPLARSLKETVRRRVLEG